MEEREGRRGTDDSEFDEVGHDLKGKQPKRSDGPSISGSAKGRDHHRKDDRKRKHKRRKEESSESDGDSSEVERRRSRRRRRRERKERNVSESGSDDSADSEELDRKERKRKRKEKRQRREEKKLKKEKRRRKADSEGDERSGEDARKKKLLKEAKKFLKKHSSNVGQELVLRAVGRQVEPISEGDYFQKNAEFATWLREGKGLFFSDLSSDQAHALFDSFVTVYNEGKMPDKYYDGITSTQVQRTGFAWAIRGRGETGEDIMAEEDRRAAERAQGKVERKKWKQEQELLLDEMLPKATGREAAQEKKAARREQQRGREDSPELMRDKDLLGGGDDFQQRLARERQRREKRVSAKAEAVAEKTTAYEAAEKAKLDQFRALIGASGGKISIPKRTG